MLLGPSLYALVVTASMFRVEVDERHWVWIALRLPPYLTKHPNIRVTHQYLSQHIQAMSGVDPDDVFGIYKWAFAFRQVVIVVPVQGLPNEILRNVNNQTHANYIRVIPDSANDASLRRWPETHHHTLG